LAKEIVRAFVSDEAAEKAAEHFTTVHQKHETPEDVPTLKVGGGLKLVDALVKSGLVASKSEARRQIEAGAVKVDEAAVTDVEAEVKSGALIQKGKRYFVKLV
jgi:tyrosyl-tRNA synthetase